MRAEHSIVFKKEGWSWRAESRGGFWSSVHSLLIGKKDFIMDLKLFICEGIIFLLPLFMGMKWALNAIIYVNE